MKNMKAKYAQLMEQHENAKYRKTSHFYKYKVIVIVEKGRNNHHHHHHLILFIYLLLLRIIIPPTYITNLKPSQQKSINNNE